VHLDWRGNNGTIRVNTCLTTTDQGGVDIVCMYICRGVKKLIQFEICQACRPFAIPFADPRLILILDHLIDK